MKSCNKINIIKKMKKIKKNFKIYVTEIGILFDHVPSISFIGSFKKPTSKSSINMVTYKD